MKTAAAIYLHALTPVHSGTGQESASIVDLPVAREKATGWPIVPASSLKGVLKASFGDEQAVLFGDTNDAGKISFGDQRLLALPVRSYRGTFAWVTCPLVLRRWERDRAALSLPPAAGASDIADASAKAVGETASVSPESALTEKGVLYLEDLDLAAAESAGAVAIAGALANAIFDADNEKKLFVERFAIVPNDVFDFLCETALEIIARIKLDEQTKTTTSGSGNLWYEEAVPAESIFAGIALAEEQTSWDALRSALRSTPVLQIGGQANVGRGLCRVRVA